ncbi:MAG: response regulator [Lachnospiraceae bacterium]|nr:response regulator [Lachnospiraceae bacterium]
MQSKRIFIIDDVLLNLQYTQHILSKDYIVDTASSSSEAIEYFKTNKPDLILLDIVMPDMDGFELFEHIKSVYGEDGAPVMFITGEQNSGNEVRAFDMGALDFIRKPFAPQVLLQRVKTQIELLDYRHRLESIVVEKTSALENFQDVISTCIAELIESRDGTTGFHIRNTTKYFKIFVNELNSRGLYKKEFTPKYIADLFRGASLHDIGKVGISDSILKKPSALSKDEYNTMKAHARIGGEAFNNMLDNIMKAQPELFEEGHEIDRDSSLGFIYAARDMALYHHEKWDGSGYPTGLSGEDIPLSARMLAIVDVYDALTAKRPYKETFSHEKSMNIIKEGRGVFFDPTLTDVFVEISDKIEKCLIENSIEMISQSKDL